MAYNLGATFKTNSGGRRTATFSCDIKITCVYSSTVNQNLRVSVQTQGIDAFTRGLGGGFAIDIYNDRFMQASGLFPSRISIPSSGTTDGHWNTSADPTNFSLPTHPYYPEPPYAPNFLYFGDGTTGHSVADGDLLTWTGSYSCTLEYDEYKGVTAGQYDGQGEPTGSGLTRFGQTHDGYTFSYASSWSSPFGASGAAGLHPAASGSVAVGEKWIFTDGDSVVVTSSRAHNVLKEPITRTVVIPSYPSSAPVNPFKIAEAAYVDVRTYGSNTSTGPGWAVEVTNITFASGIWTPLSYSGGRLESGYAGVQLDVAPGSFKLTNPNAKPLPPIQAQGATSCPLRLVGNIYMGEALADQDVVLLFGNSAAPSNTPGTPSNAALNLRAFTVSGGQIDTTFDQIYSNYATDLQTQWSPALPAPRNDYTWNACTMVTGSPGAYDYAIDPYIFFQDDEAWTATTFTHAASQLVDDFSSISGWTGIHATLGVPNLTITATAAGAGAQFTSGYGKDFRAYRYLKINLTAPSGLAQLTLDVGDTGWGTKSFTFAVQSGTHDYVIDLCNPNSVAAPDYTRTGYDGEGSIYGVQTVGNMTLRGLASGQALTLNRLTLVRQGMTLPGRVAAEFVVNDQLPEAETYVPDILNTNVENMPDSALYGGLGTNNHLYARHFQARSDGKIAVDLPHAIQVYPFKDSSGHLWRTVLTRDRLAISDFVSLANAIPGLHCTGASTVNKQKYFGETVGEASGGVYTPSAPAIYLTLDNGIVKADADIDTASVNLKARAFFDGQGGWAGQPSTTYAFLKRMYSTVDGLVVNPSGASAQNVSVHLAPYATGTGIASATTTADADGYFRFPGYYTELALTINTAQSSGKINPHRRGRRWIGLTGVPASDQVRTGVSYDVSVSGRHAHAFVQDATIRVGLATGVPPSGWNDLDTMIAGSFPSLRWDRRSKRQWLWLLAVEAAGGVKLRYSPDEGVTFLMSTTLSTTATAGTHVWTDHGLHYCYYRVPGASGDEANGKIKGQVFDAQGNAVLAEFTAISSGVDDAGLAADDFVAGSGAWYVGLTYFSGGHLVYKSGRDGQNFS